MNWDLNLIYLSFPGGFPGGSAGKESTCNARDLGSIPGLGRSPGEGNSYPLQYSGLKKSMDCIVPGVAKGKVYFLMECKCKSGTKIVLLEFTLQFQFLTIFLAFGI